MERSTLALQLIEASVMEAFGLISEVIVMTMDEELELEEFRAETSEVVGPD